MILVATWVDDGGTVHLFFNPHPSEYSLILPGNGTKAFLILIAMVGSGASLLPCCLVPCLLRDVLPVVFA